MLAFRHAFRRDHPRIRGEHAVADATAWLDRGIIPAYAGSTPMN